MKQHLLLTEKKYLGQGVLCTILNSFRAVGPEGLYAKQAVHLVRWKLLEKKNISIAKFVFTNDSCILVHL